MDNEALKPQRPDKATAPGCEEVESLLGSLVDGMLCFNTTVQVLDHVHHCRRCSHLLLEFRKFVLEEPPSPTFELEEKATALIAAQSSPFWAQWQDRLQRWLDVVFPGTVMTPIYRGAPASVPASSHWEMSARRQSEQPFFSDQREDIQITVHMARGHLFGRVGRSDGEPLYPALLTLVSEDGQESVLSQPDGTFQLRWDPEATRLECQSPLGAVIRFTLPGG